MGIEQLVCLLKSHKVWVGLICMVDDGLVGPCTGDVGVANAVSALWSIGWQCMLHMGYYLAFYALG